MGEGIITAHRTNCVSKRLVCSFAQERQADGEVGIGGVSGKSDQMSIVTRSTCRLRWLSQ